MDVIKNYSKVIEQINSKFGTKFVPFTPTDSQKEEIFSQIRRISIRNDGYENTLRTSRPTAEKQNIKEIIIHTMEEKMSNKLALAETVYNKLIYD